MAAPKKKKKRRHKLSTGFKTVSKYDKQYSSTSSDSTDVSDNEVILPDLAHIRSSKSIQRQIDQSIARLGKKQEGNDQSNRIKSKRGGSIEVVVKQKVAWSHECILGGQSRQSLTYNQLTLTQFVQGYVKNVSDEDKLEVREAMLQYLGDLMEDATDFS